LEIKLLMKIWTLKTDNSEIGSIYITTEQEALYYTELFDKRFYTQKAIRENWTDTLIYNLPDSDFSKFIFSGKEFWICSEKAKQFISPLLKKNVEFLPLIHREQVRKKISYHKQLFRRKIYKPLLEMMPDAPHYLLNILDIKPLNIIDLEKSILRYDDKKDTIYRVDKLAFDPHKTENAHLFKIDYSNTYFRSATFVSDEFRQAVEQNHLTGLKFSEAHEDEGGNLIWQS